MVKAFDFSPLIGQSNEGVFSIFLGDKECLNLTKQSETVCTHSAAAQTIDRGEPRQVPWLYLSSKHLYFQTFLNTKCPQINNPIQL